MKNSDWDEKPEAFRESIHEKAQKSLSALKDFHSKVDGFEFADQRVVKVVENVENNLRNYLSKLSKSLEELLPQAEWTTFNIGFFGETNAGKSTVIEALIRGDGGRIGDGRKDFTQYVEPIAHATNGRETIHFLDMPGIEGNENSVRDEIRRAVRKSHVVFYIHGNKIPEKHTLIKMREYLNNYARVFSLMNVRGKPASYRYKKKILNQDEQTTFREAQRAFQQELGSNYSGGTAVNGFLGFLAQGKPVRKDLIKDQKKALEVLGEPKNILNFSEFHRLEGRIYHLERDARTILSVSNSYKIIWSHQKLLSSMLKDKKEIDLLVKELHDEAERNIQRIEDGFKRAADDIALRVDAHFGRIRNEAKREVQRLLDEGESREGEINQKISTLIKDGAKSIEREVDKRIKILEEELRLIINESEKRLHWKFRFGRVQGDGIDIRSILEELSVGFGYIFSKIFDLGSSILGIVVAFGINPLLGVITMIVSFFRQGRGWFKHDPGKRLRNAKERASKEIEKYFDRLDKSFQKNLSNELEKVRREMRSHVRQFRNLAMAIKDFSRLMNKFLEIIQEQMTAISTELAKYVLQSRVIDACVIDLGLQSACIIGRVEKEERLKEKRLKNDLRVNRLYIYSSFKDFLNNLDHRIEDGALIVTDPNEFKRRVASALKKAMGFETIRKERSYAN